MLQTLRRKRSEEGFTLIELLIVIIILAILAAIVIFAVGSTTKNAAVAACKSTVKTVQTALEAFKADTPTGSYPTSITALTTVTATNTDGPWLKQKPDSTVTKDGYAITGYNSSAGTFLVETKSSNPAGIVTSSTAICKGA